MAPYQCRWAQLYRDKRNTRVTKVSSDTDVAGGPAAIHGGDLQKTVRLNGSSRFEAAGLPKGSGLCRSRELPPSNSSQPRDFRCINWSGNLGGCHMCPLSTFFLELRTSVRWRRDRRRIGLTPWPRTRRSRQGGWSARMNRPVVTLVEVCREFVLVETNIVFGCRQQSVGATAMGDFDRPVGTGLLCKLRIGRGKSPREVSWRRTLVKPTVHDAGRVAQ